MRYTLLFIIIALFQFNLGIAQSKKLPQSVIDDYAYHLYLSYKYNDHMKVVVYSTLRSIDPRLSMVDIEVGMESLTTNKRFREATFQVWTDRYGTRRDFLMAELTGIGMSAKNAQILIEYLVVPIEKERKQAEKEKQLKEAENRRLAAIEKKRRDEEQQRLMMKASRLREKTYDLNDRNNSFDFESFKRSLLHNLEQQLLSREDQVNEISVDGYYNYSYEDYPGKINSGIAKLTAVNNAEALPISTKEFPNSNFEIDGIQVPVKITIDSIKIRYHSGIASVKLKKSKISFEKPTPDIAVQQSLTNVLKGKDRGKYTIPYVIGEINEIKIEKLDVPAEPEKKKNYIGTFIGGGIVLAGLIFGSL